MGETREQLEAMGAIELRQAAKARGLLVGIVNWRGIGKADVVDLLCGDVTEADVLAKHARENGFALGTGSASTVPAGGDLASVIAQAIAGYMPAPTASVDADAVRAIVADVVPPMIAAAMDGRRPVQVVANGVPGPVVSERTHEAFAEVCQLVASGLPVLLVGPAGTGKTTLARQVATALGRRFSFNSMSSGCSESHLVGRTLPDSTGNWTYKPAPFVTTYRDGGVHLFDEIDAADPNLMVMINAALANGHLSIPFEDMIVERHAETAIICAANTFGTGASRQYVGRNALDAATLDRFAVSTVVVGYDRDLERSIARGILPNADADAVLSWAWGVRERIETCALRRIMSTRTIVGAARRIAGGAALADVAASYFAGWSDDEKARVGDAAIPGRMAA